ncbi:MAG: 6-carboxytetrahydropterin synthase [Marinifilaceae bacterium]|jgi:6-pyruvoyltetrahydropterin/6-carboxytetrahydropterin synthase|nr:6-carboxytetrahydropterin synthase [Marinifilaceae bacterium]
MPKIRLTKSFNFEMAHALWNYDGLCKNIHGHSYIFYVTVIGEPITDEKNPKLGMVMDFGELKRIVNTEIVDKLDHALVINKKAPMPNIESIKQMYDRFYTTNYQPTCENMISEFAELISAKLPENIKLHSLKLHETANSFAEWYASDNIE